MTNQVAIVGAGPAGIAAAIQLRRAGIRPLLFEQKRIGGLLNNAFLVENYPGFPQGISGKDLGVKLRQHLRRLRIKVIQEKITRVSQKRKQFTLQGKRQYNVPILVIASGTKPKLFPLQKNKFPGKIYYEIYPIRNIKDKKVIIVGAGDAALDYALHLSQHNTVTILNRSKTIKGLSLLFNRVQAKTGKNKIIYLGGARLSSIKQTGNRLLVIALKKKSKKTLSCDYILFAIGREPALDFISASILKKYPRGNKKLYFIGDVARGDLRQTSIAVGDGVATAMKISLLLNAERLHGVYTDV
jgi:thioredoxin reductase (NADPH)